MEVAEEGYLDNVGIMVEDSYWNLLNSYGWEVTDTINGGHGPTDWTDETIEYNGTNAPFYFVRAGGLNRHDGVYRGGYGANFWSKSTAMINWSDRPVQRTVIMLGIYDEIGPSRVDNSLANSLSLRCLTQ